MSTRRRKPHLLVNLGLAVVALLSAAALAWWGGKKVAMTAMPQMVALYNGMGGGAAGAIAAVELFGNKAARSDPACRDAARRADRRRVAVRFADRLGQARWRPQEAAAGQGQQVFNGLVMLATLAVGGCHRLRRAGRRRSLLISTHGLIYLFFGFALIFGILMTLPIGGADMPVVISIYNAFTGLAVGLEGFVLQNPALMIAGMVVGAAGTLLTLLMAKAMNRSVSNVLFTNFGDVRQAQARRHQRQPEAGRGRRRRHLHALRQERHHRAGLRPGRRAGHSRSSMNS